MTAALVRRPGRAVMLACVLLLVAGVAFFGHWGAPGRQSVPYPSEAWCETAMSTWTQETFAHKPVGEQLEEVMCEWLTQDGHRYGPARVASAGVVRPSREVLAQNAVVAAVNGYCRSYGRYAWVTVNRVTHAVSAGCVKAGSVYPS